MATKKQAADEGIEDNVSGFLLLACTCIAITMMMRRPTAATGVRAGAMSVAQGAIRPIEAASSVIAVNLITGRETGATPVWPDAMSASFDRVAFCDPENVKTAARTP